jgi:hypothetical protein
LGEAATLGQYRKGRCGCHYLGFLRLRPRDVVFAGAASGQTILRVEHPGLALSPIAAGDPTALRSPENTLKVYVVKRRIYFH